MRDRILLTGATGFLGKHVLPRLAASSEVFAVARRRGAVPASSGAHEIIVDLTEDLNDQLPERLDVIVHLAQSRHYRDFPEHADDMFSVNVASTAQLLEHARRAGVKRFVQASSGSVYGNGTQSQDEGDSARVQSFYSSTKYSAELLARAYEQVFDVVVLRPFVIYGEGQGGMLVSTLLDRVVSGETITISGQPGLQTNPIHVSDAAQVFVTAARLERSAIIDVAGDEIVDLTQLVTLMADIAGQPCRIEYSPGTRETLVGDNRLMIELLGVPPHVALRDGLTRMLRWTDGGDGRGRGQ